MCEPTGDNAFGYHFFFTTAEGNSCYYSVIPSLDDTCLINTGCSGGGCSLSLSQTQEQRRTQVTSHEFAEMATDPAFPSGWFGPASDENGDICNGEADSITVGANTWDVQRTYSKTDDIATNGASFCLTTAPNPIPKLSPRSFRHHSGHDLGTAFRPLQNIPSPADRFPRREDSPDKMGEQRSRALRPTLLLSVASGTYHWQFRQQLAAVC